MTHVPQNLKAENAVLGACLQNDRPSLALVLEGLRPGDLYQPVNQAVFEAILALDGQGAPVDFISVAAQMRKDGTFCKLKAYNNEAYLVALSTEGAIPETLPHYLTLLRDATTLRGAAVLGADLHKRALCPSASAAEVLDQAETSLFSLSLRSAARQPTPLGQTLKDSLKALEARFGKDEQITGVPTGYTRLDHMTAGLQPGDLVILGGRPSMGKTALALGCAVHAALKEIPALVFSLEMTKQSLTDRLLCGEARVDASKYRTGDVDNRDVISLHRAAGRLAPAPLLIDDSSSPTLAEIRGKARRWRMGLPRGSKALVVVDYIQLIQAVAKEKTTREQEVSEISRGLKALAKDLAVPVVALSQLSRKCEERVDKRPVSADLRDSGQIEQDADLILFVYRDEVYKADSPDAGTAEIIVSKQRSGPTGMVRLAFLNQYTRFENLAHATH